MHFCQGKSEKNGARDHLCIVTLILRNYAYFPHMWFLFKNGARDRLYTIFRGYLTKIVILYLQKPINNPELFKKKLWGHYYEV